ncbi:MAG: chorismate mutase family protein [Pseudomonadaceae bacterium]|nr:chorismate mutase family protein [Pseudomonadaceae bacterium]
MEKLADFRKQINALDIEIIALLGKRLDVCRNVGEYKKANEIPMMQSARVGEVKDRVAKLGAEHKLDPDFMRSLYTLIIDEACRIEDEIIDG